MYRAEIVRLAHRAFSEASNWQFHQLAELLRQPVCSLYPDQGNESDECGEIHDAMNQVIYPSNPSREIINPDNPLTIAWTRAAPSKKNSNVNHFVAVVE